MGLKKEAAGRAGAEKAEKMCIRDRACLEHRLAVIPGSAFALRALWL